MKKFMYFYRNLKHSMQKSIWNIVLFISISFLFITCANKGTPGGGPKDETPPEIVKSEPDNFSVHFNTNEIKIYFDEYIKLKDIQKQLIISPPMKTQPLIKPLGGASKFITITIFDTLQPNTTYAFNFGNSIQDNNEGNPFSYFRYVFSTGDYIDSLTVSGAIKDAFDKETESFVNVALYEVDSTFKDSIIYKEVPKYITNTLDSLTTFTIENIKEGKYLLVGLKDNNGDNKFQQKSDKIAFYDKIINVPSDTTYVLRLFKEDIDFKSIRPKLLAGEKIAFGFEGDYKNMNITLLSEVPEDFEYRITKDEKTDSLYYWYKPRLESDSLHFKVTHLDFETEYMVKISDQKRDSLVISASPSGIIGFDEAFKLRGSTPFMSFDEAKFSIMDKDSTDVPFSAILDSVKNMYHINFDKTEDNKYRIQILPEALSGFFENTNDTLSYTVNTKKVSDYGYVRINMLNAKYPAIVQLTDSKGEVKAEHYALESKPLDFLNLSPGIYSIRVIHDANGNKKYDTGNYLKKIQPEHVSHFEMSEEVRSDWGLIETLQFNPN